MDDRPIPALGERAVVLGASLAGLLAARVLSEAYDEVVLLERDALPAGAGLRKGTPQALHAHGLLARGYQALEALFPGFGEAIVARGGELGDLQACVGLMAGYRRFAGGSAGVNGLVASRPLIEAELRRRVLALPNVRLREGVEVLGPLHDAPAHRITGARLARRDAAGAADEERLAADLVVDATGRGSHGPVWLAACGYHAPREERVTVGIGYATAYFERRPEHAGELKVFIFSATPELPRSGALLAAEPEEGGDAPRWVLTLAGYAGDHPALSHEALRQRALQLGCPELIRITHEARRLGPVMRFGFPHSVWRHYEELARLPGGFLPIGDAMASFNPVYGQGMTVAATEALLLREVLRGGPVGLQRRFLRGAARLIAAPWQLAVGADLAIPSVPGRRPASVRLVNAYLARLQRVAVDDPEVSLAFYKVLHLLAPPPSVMAPRVLRRVLFGKPGPVATPVANAPARAH